MPTAKTNAQRQADHCARTLQLDPDQIRLVIDALEFDLGTTSDPVARARLHELSRYFRNALALSPART